jgi:tetratricopeptide (TPR) repeat protein
LAALAACKHAPTSQGAASLAEPVAEGKALFESGELDQAMAKLLELPDDPDSLYYQGRVWAKKAETAPLPTPPPLSEPLPRGAEPPAAPEFKPEELQAMNLFQRAVATRSDHAAAQLAIAGLLAPHAVRYQEMVTEREAAARRHGSRKGKAQPAPIAPASTQGVDYSVERVVQAYQLAAQADTASGDPAEGLIAFGIRAHRLDAAESGHQELVRRLKENPEPLIRYGDFLATQKHDQLAAIEQYRQALIWKPDDEATRAKVAEIFLARGVESFGKQQYAVAETQFKEADRYITDKSSPLGQRLQGQVARLREIRQATK